MSQRVGIGGTVVRGIWISRARGGGYGCCVRNRTARGGTDYAGCLVGNLASRWHRNGIVNIAGAAGAEPGSPAALGGGMGHTGEGAREGIPNDRAADLARPGVCHYNGVGVL